MECKINEKRRKKICIYCFGGFFSCLWLSMFWKWLQSNLIRKVPTWKPFQWLAWQTNIPLNFHEHQRKKILIKKLKINARNPEIVLICWEEISTQWLTCHLPACQPVCRRRPASQPLPSLPVNARGLFICNSTCRSLGHSFNYLGGLCLHKIALKESNVLKTILPNATF